jgi:hypothetical protein
MDPYLEAPDIWPEFHNRFAAQISADLNGVLPRPFYARLEMRQEVGLLDAPDWSRVRVPDVAVVRHRARGKRRAFGRGAATVALASPVVVRISCPPFRHTFVEIRDSSRGHRLVTLIEIVSPSNKRPGEDRRNYQDKQREILDSDASLLEIDLLRSGRPVYAHPGLEDQIAAFDPVHDYLVLVNRAWRRIGDVAEYEVHPIVLTNPLPVVGVPLNQGMPDIVLDLQRTFSQTYDSGPYDRGAVDYDDAPEPPLDPARMRWLAHLLRQAGFRTSRRRR